MKIYFYVPKLHGYGSNGLQGKIPGRGCSEKYSREGEVCSYRKSRKGGSLVGADGQMRFLKEKDKKE